MHIVMELCSGGDLDQLVRARHGNLLSEARVLRLLPRVSVLSLYVRVDLHQPPYACGRRQCYTYSFSSCLPSTTSTAEVSCTGISTVAMCLREATLLCGGSRRYIVACRDLKLSNLFIYERTSSSFCGTVKIGDFGISKQLLDSDAAASVVGERYLLASRRSRCSQARPTQLCQRTGTPQYMAPEALAGKPYGRSADVWALGCILYELLTLKRAFDATNLGTMYTKIMEGAYKPVSEQYSPDVRELLDSTLRKEPHERPSVAQLLEVPHVWKHLQLYARFACAKDCEVFSELVRGMYRWLRQQSQWCRWVKSLVAQRRESFKRSLTGFADPNEASVCGLGQGCSDSCLRCTLEMKMLLAVIGLASSAVFSSIRAQHYK